MVWVSCSVYTKICVALKLLNTSMHFLKIKDSHTSCVYVHSIASDSAIPWIVAHQAPLPMKLSKQEYWSGLPFPSPGDLSDPGTEPVSPTPLHWQAVPLLLNHQRSPHVHPRLLQINSYCYQSPWPLFTDQHFFFLRQAWHACEIFGRKAETGLFILSEILSAFLVQWGI